MNSVNRLCCILMCMISAQSYAEKSSHEKEVTKAQNYLRGMEASVSFNFTMFDDRLDNLSAHCQGFMDKAEEMYGIPKGRGSIQSKSIYATESAKLAVIQFGKNEIKCIYSGRKSLVKAIYYGADLYKNTLLIESLGLGVSVAAQ